MWEIGKIFIRYLDCFVVYFSIQLGRCVLFSFIALAVLMLLRYTILRNRIFLKGMSWVVFLVIPFVGKLKLFYEASWMVRTFWWWNSACMQFAWVRYGYMAGVLITAIIIFYRRRRVRKFVSGMEKTNLYGTNIWLGDFSVTPFTTGLIRPKIALPRVMTDSFSQEELKLVCLHEQMHIRLGHLWLYFLWDIGRSLLWVNPLLSICTKYMREDLEDICDRVTIQRSGKSAYEYGKLLLKSMLVLQREPMNLTAAFAGARKYQITKKRFTRISEFQSYKTGAAVCVGIGGIVVVIGLFCLIHEFSYPNYTEYEDILILNDADEFVLIENQDALNRAIQIDEDEVMVDQKKMKQIFDGQGIVLESYFILFGGYTKLPGIGGGGNAVYVSGRETDERLRLSYQNNDTRFITRLFKWL